MASLPTSSASGAQPASSAAATSSSSGSSPSDVLFRGQLHKKSEWSNSWSLRDVCLSQRKLIYTHVWRADPGVLPVSHILRVHKVLHDPCRFSIETKARLLMHFRSTQPAFCDTWVKHIRANVDALKARRARGSGSSGGGAEQASDQVPHDHLRIPIMIREGAEVVGRYKMDLPVRSSVYNLRELIADRLGLQLDKLVLEGFDGAIITRDKDLLAIIDAPASMMKRIVVTLPLHSSPRSSVQVGRDSDSSTPKPDAAHGSAAKADGEDGVDDAELAAAVAKAAASESGARGEDAPPPAYDSLYSGVSQASAVSGDSADEEDILSPLLEPTAAPGGRSGRAHSFDANVDEGPPLYSPSLGGGSIGIPRNMPRHDSFAEDTNGPQRVLSVYGDTEGNIGSYTTPSFMSTRPWAGSPAPADAAGSGESVARRSGAPATTSRDSSSSPAGEPFSLPAPVVVDAGNTPRGRSSDAGQAPSTGDAPPPSYNALPNSDSGELSRNGSPAQTRPVALNMGKFLSVENESNAPSQASGSIAAAAVHPTEEQPIEYSGVRSPQGFCVTAIESFQNQRFIWLRGWVPLSTSYAQPDHSDFLGLQRVPRNANTFRSLKSIVDEISERALGASGEDIEYRWLDEWRLDTACEEAEWVQPAQVQPASAPAYMRFQDYKAIVDPHSGWTYAKRYEDFLQAAKCRRQPRAFDCQRRRRWIRLVHIQRKPKPISPIQAPDTDVFAADINANVPDGHQGDFEAESGAAICPSTDEDDAPQHLLCPISGKLLEDPVVLSSGHTYERKALDEFVATHRVTTDGDDAIDGEDGDASIPLLFLTEPLPTHACIVDAAEVSGTAEGGGKGVTAFMKQQVYSNLLALAAVDDFTAQSQSRNTGSRQRSSTRSLLAAAEVDHYDEDDEIAYLLDPITYEALEDPVCTRYGHTYSRAIVQECIQRRKEDPTCCLPLEQHEVVPNLLASYLLAANNMNH